MRKLFLSLLVMGSALCAHAQDHYTISGVADGTEEGDTVYLCNMEGFFSMVPLDTAYVHEGKYSFTGSYNGACLRFMLPMHKGKPLAMADFVLENAPIYIHTFAVDSIKPEVKGGPVSVAYHEYENKIAVFDSLTAKPWDISRDSTQSEAVRKAAEHTLDSLRAVRDAFTKAYIYDHAPSALSAMLLYYNQSSYKPEELDAVLAKMSSGPHYACYSAIMAERKAQAATAVGKQYTDIALEGTNGKVVKVSSYVSKNKYTLIDFWASWCGPCRAEMPNVVKAYSTYHAKGFEVVGVSLDNNKQAWVKAIATLKMPWPQMSDLKGWDSAGAAAYNIKAIPSNVLVDSKGVIVAKDLRGEDLQNKLAELFK
jgi:thiol-disulfide isomerase/thioredoxin